MTYILAMKVSRKTVLLASFLLTITTFSDVGYSADPITSCPKETEYNLNSTSGRAYINNVESLLSELSSKASNPNGFYNFTAVTPGAATAYGQFYCNGDATPAECQTCVETASSDILQECTNKTAAVIWAEKCVLRFSDKSIFSRLDTDNGWYAWNAGYVADITLLNQVLGDAFDEIATDAAYDGVSGKKFAVRESDYMLFQRIYSMGQCSPDLSNLDCLSCLIQAISKLPEFCYGRPGGRVLYPSCRIRYEMFPFFRPPPPYQGDQDDIITTLIVVLGIPFFGSIIIFIIVVSKQIKNRREAEKTDADVSNVSTETEYTWLSETEEQ